MRRIGWMLVGLVMMAASAFAQGTVDAERLSLWTGGSIRANLTAGSGAPSGGTLGDYYIDYATANLYRRLSGSWDVVPMTGLTNTWTALQTFTGGVTLSGGLTAGSGSVGIINSAGKIPALTSTYFASLDGSSLTGSPTFTTVTLANNTVLQSGGNDILEQYRSTNPQRVNVYNTRTSGTNNEYGYLWWNSNIFRIGTDAGSGGGTDRNIEFEPGGTLAMRVATDLSVNVASHLNPITNLTSRLGDSAHKYSLIYGGELVVGTLIAQQTVATIGGRVIVAPTNLLTSALAPAGGTITVKYNNLSNGDRIYLESGGNVEWMAVTSAAGGSAGVYTYTVTRNLDGSGANDWTAGDAVVDTGTTGNGFIDLYSTSGVLSGTGPSIVGNVRTGTTYNNIAARWAIGNLDGLYSYSGSAYGACFGDAAASNICIDPTNGVRIRQGTTNYAVLSSSTFTLGAAGGQRVVWDGTNLTIVSDTLTVDTNGVAVTPNSTTSYATKNGYRFTSSTGDFGVFGYEVGGGTPSKSMAILANGISGTSANQIYIATLAATGITLNSSTTAASTAIDIRARTLTIAGDVGNQGALAIGANVTLTDQSGGSNAFVIQPGTGATAFIGTSSADDVALLANNATQGTLCSAGGITIGAPTGGCKGAGTLNVSGGLYLNGTLYTNPEPALQAMQAVIDGLEARIAVMEQRLSTTGGRQ